jgi:hypothetical protein
MSFAKFAMTVMVLATASSSWHVSAKLSNPVTDWLKAAQKTVAALGIPNQIAARSYAFVALSQYKALTVLKSQATYKNSAAAKKKKLQAATQGAPRRP